MLHNGVAYQPSTGELGGLRCKSQGGLGARDSVLGKGIIPAVFRYQMKFCEPVRNWS